MRTTFESVVQGNQLPNASVRALLARRMAAPPTHWWRIRSPHDFSMRDVGAIRQALLKTDLVSDCDWFRAVGGDAAAAIGIAIKGLKSHGMRNPVTDAVVSAVLCCAVEGNPAAKVVMISALWRRAKIDPVCYGLRLRWLHARF
ncbi:MULTISPECIES: hypothetical protein [unclassified Bradyrhizobium]|uniref:hypothetical protein n=1 Tax=unclassified Bradyrhizobium TaxID=2631580 RepID=UPI00247AA93F|nr:MULTISPECIES: hypothetical protein [unclassified Bradyrhizobium]WGS20183.1 hypothetical protein MTX22_38845 [Bradyrhizobium sp. ISRA463]WGS27046.1 hypothetical protein MTX19_36270 [Bradyrhizobium sp. ISRA464]